MLILRTKTGTEVRVPVQDVESITEVEPLTGESRPVPPHPYLHREGVKRCAACWQDPQHPAHQ